MLAATNPHKNKSNNSSSNGFQALNLSPAIFAGIKKLGYRTPTPVQRKSLPILLTGSDACVMARTGSEFMLLLREMYLVICDAYLSIHFLTLFNFTSP